MYKFRVRGDRWSGERERERKRERERERFWDSLNQTKECGEGKRGGRKEFSDVVEDAEN